MPLTTSSSPVAADWQRRIGVGFVGLVRRDTLMIVVNRQRAAEFDQIRASVISWAEADSAIVGVALVGSWARDQARAGSDVDFVLLTTDVDRFAESTHWLEPALSQPAAIIRTQLWGELTERRARVASGLEIEFGFVEPTWASIDPVDPGTRQVVSDGCMVLYDRHRILTRLVEEVHPAPHA